MPQIAGKGPYTKGLHDLGNGCYAWLQPDGSWGWSNAGLVVDSGESLLVDTLFDLKLTGEMLTAAGGAESYGANQHAGQYSFQWRPHVRQSTRAGRRDHF